MVTVAIKLENTEGGKKSVTIAATNPKIRTMTGGKSYRDGDLVQLAADGKLSDAVLEESPALRGINQDQAIDMVAERVSEGSTNLVKVADAPKKGKNDDVSDIDKSGE
jgi:hypothetical protein